MGAVDFTEVATGKTVAEAFNAAREAATWEYGHGGYTGSIAEKDGVVMFELPARLSPDKLLNWVSQFEFLNEGEYLRDDLRFAKEALATAKPGTKRNAQARVKAAEKAIRENQKEIAKFKREVGVHLALVREMADVYGDKWGPAVGFEITSPTLKKQLLQGRNGAVKRGDRVFYFCGIASS